MQRRVVFRGTALPWALLAPQLAVTAVFFFWPAAQAIRQAFEQTDAFGLSTRFVGLENFADVLADPGWRGAAGNTAVFALAVTALAMGSALFLAVQADKAIRGRALYRTLLVWPYAVAPAVAAILWLFLFHPSIGLVGRALNAAGVAWDWKLNGAQAMLLVVLAAAWKQVSYDFLFFLAGLQAIPRGVLEAAAIDGARPLRRFWTITLPLLAPTTAFLLTVNLVYAFFDSFGVIHALTGGGPGRATETLIYKAYVDGVSNLNLGASAAQSVLLMVLVVGLTALQFRFLGRRVAT